MAIIDLMSHKDAKERPECLDVLDQFGDWSLTIEQVYCEELLKKLPKNEEMFEFLSNFVKSKINLSRDDKTQIDQGNNDTIYKYKTGIALNLDFKCSVFYGMTVLCVMSTTFW